MASTERRTKRALSKPSSNPTPKNTPTIRCPDNPAASIATAVIPTLITKSRTGRKATEGNTNGASCAGVVTAAPQSQIVERQTPDRPIGGPPSVSHVTLELPKG